jgi:hypothetical protein
MMIRYRYFTNCFIPYENSSITLCSILPISLVLLSSLVIVQADETFATKEITNTTQTEPLSGLTNIQNVFLVNPKPV